MVTRFVLDKYVECNTKTFRMPRTKNNDYFACDEFT